MTSDKDDVQKEHREYARTLTSEEIMLIRLRDELYESSWERMQRDLKNRLLGKPHIFKLANKIEADLESISKLSAYESENKINLKDYI